MWINSSSNSSSTVTHLEHLYNYCKFSEQQLLFSLYRIICKSSIYKHTRLQTN